MSNVDDAEFILAHGTEALGLPSGDPLPQSLDELEQVLMLALEKRLPMVVANPDYVTVEARDLRVMPGIITAFTKFSVELYRICLTVLFCCMFILTYVNVHYMIL